jgi:hypothetical protein
MSYTDFKPTMFAADVADIGEGATYTTDSAAIDVSGLEWATIQCYTTGANAGSAGTVTFYLSMSGDGTNYSTVGMPLYLTLAGAAQVVTEPVEISLRGINKLKIINIINGDATYHLTNTNVIVSCVKK